MDPRPDEPVLAFTISADFDRWLAKHHSKAAVVWIKYATKGSGEPSITMTEADDVALCHGWIDDQSKSLGERYYLQRFTPRRPASNWSKINRDRVARLIGEGRMRPAGLAEVERAKADGRWDAAYDSPRTAEVPDDLARALERRPAARAAFAKLTSANRFSILSANRFSILHRLQIAKQPQTRARRIEAVVTTLDVPAALQPARRRPARPASKVRR